MPGQTPIYAYPYLEGSDNGKQIKTVSKALAERIEATMQNAGSVPLDADLTALLTRMADLEAQVDSLPAPDDSGWVALPLANGWVTFGGSYGAPRYRRLNGTVYVQALVKSGAAGVGTVIAQLPAGFRPSQQFMHSTASATSAATASYVDVTAGGAIVCGNPVYTGWLSLEITFPADQ